MGRRPRRAVRRHRNHQNDRADQRQEPLRQPLREAPRGALQPLARLAHARGRPLVLQLDGRAQRAVTAADGFLHCPALSYCRNAAL